MSLPQGNEEKPVTDLDVAQWMLDAIDREGELPQEDAVHSIAKLYGDEFTYDNEGGNLAISRAVLRHFRKLTGDAVVWEQGTKMWRKRQPHDEPGRQQH